MMSSSGKKRYGAEFGLMGVLAAGLVASIVLTAGVNSDRRGDSDHKKMIRKQALKMDFQTLEKLSGRITNPVRSEPDLRNLLLSELRVVAIGSAYPIPYEAEVCPFSGVPQPAMNQLDRDGDGITDDWELKYGLDKYNAADALVDAEGDGFTNLEEFQALSDPLDAASHPPYATKLRFVERKDIPFFLVFQGFTELSDEITVFQLNAPATGKSHFASVGEAVEDIVIQRFEPAEDGRKATLYVMRGSSEIMLERGAVALDPESKAELINILDRSPIMVTMGALLSLHKDEYTVLGVYPDKVILKDTRTGAVFDIVGLADGDR